MKRHASGQNIYIYYYSVQICLIMNKKKTPKNSSYQEKGILVFRTTSGYGSGLVECSRVFCSSAKSHTAHFRSSFFSQYMYERDATVRAVSEHPECRVEFTFSLRREKNSLTDGATK